MLIPVISSPLIKDHCIGAAPLYLGSNDACIFIDPNLGNSMYFLGRIRKATTTNISTFKEDILKNAYVIKII